MTTSELFIFARISELESLILKARNDYYNGEPTVQDEQFDAWVDELSELKEGSEAVVSVGAPVSASSGWKKAKHGFVMGSLDKVNTVDELTFWLLDAVKRGLASQGQSLFMTEKLDGISIHLRYVKGAFSQAITRGDGTEGEDISQNVSKMKGVIGRLSDNFTGSIRGEIVLTKEDHKNYFSSYANLRNAASGISKRYDGVGCEHLTVIVYEVVGGQDFQTEADQWDWLLDQGFSVPNSYLTAMSAGVKTPQDIWVDYQQTKRLELNYDIDGLVVRINDLPTQQAMGSRDGRPRGAVAFKFAPVTRETIIQKIEWQVGGSGRLTPVATFKPVQLLGATVVNASLYNYKYIKDLGVGIGSKVLVARANDVIPRVVSVVGRAGEPSIAPVRCPVCETPLVVFGEYHICPNQFSCPAQVVGRIKRYISELSMKEVGDTLVERLVEAGLVKTPSDLYALTVEKISVLDRMGLKSAQTVLSSIQGKKELELDQLLGALSIPGIGSTTVRMVMNAGIDTWEKMQASKALDFEKISGLGEVKALALFNWIQDYGVTTIPQMITSGVTIKAKFVGKFTGSSFCFTGTMKNKRSHLESLVKSGGGEVKPSVVKGLSYLVLADASSTSAKAVAARKNGTKCISEEDFLGLVGV
jgi:DNA ligase (NAD+)